VHIYPGAFISTTGKGTITFKKNVTVIGNTQVFDTGANLYFADNSLAILNPVWWGARGDDNIDDTEILKKVIQISMTSPYTQTIQIPFGNLYISNTLIIDPTKNSYKRLIIEGLGYSSSATRGSSLTWVGENNGSMLILQNIHNAIIREIDFTSSNGKSVNCNLELRPFMSNLQITNCNFSGVSGINSANISLNEGNQDQVSEIRISNSNFRGVINSKNNERISQSAIAGGLGNCKNFYISDCSFMPYKGTAINITNSDMFVVDNCTFAENGLDIRLNDGIARLESNYSENSGGFYENGFSSSIHQSYLVGNYFAGIPRDQLVIRDGSGELFLINNNFGGNGPSEENKVAQIKWEMGTHGSITSIGNFYKGSSETKSPFKNRSGISIQMRSSNKITSLNDLGGISGADKIRFKAE